MMPKAKLNPDVLRMSINQNGRIIQLFETDPMHFSRRVVGLKYMLRITNEGDTRRHSSMHFTHEQMVQCTWDTGIAP